MANLSRNVILSLIIAILSVVYGFLTNVIDDSVTEDPGQVHLLEENRMEKEVKERALEQLQEVGQENVSTRSSQNKETAWKSCA